MNNTNNHIPAREAMFNEHMKSFIEKEWIRAGRPHNIICSQCLKPGNLLWCSTCSRSYHFVCLVSPPSVDVAASWLCPSCQERQAALNFEYKSLPSGNGDPTSGSNISGSSFSGPAYAMAKKFLANHGLANNQAITSDFLDDLQQLIVKAELASQKESELLKLRHENSQLMEELISNRARSGSQLSPQSQLSPAYNSQHGTSATPSYPPSRNEISKLDVTDKSWDRIISEAF
ncbi:PHD finger protein [Talaromyces stipitatus ATCC 10500]|uniref:PHD finger protein n=1 Tax=Talaromyces stipitatus (strain ATCC 10500 / CBS 375.48 / QM 6759 / NRRL 1006) TaxID=441959 RepID=B8M059_TALSN|nr:PHD finger protein [Talaromyces stipitatus ATCC 10500]EED21156.1 PHD finger protein [Talaromyces stipitatus ATCC 10500]